MLNEEPVRAFSSPCRKLPRTPKERDELMEEVAGATAMLRRTGRFTRKDEFRAFMSIFHPDTFADRDQMYKLEQSLRSPEERL